MDVKERIIQECLEVLGREDVKDEIKNITKPLIELILKEIYPYIYISIIFVLISFLLILGIFVILLRNKINFLSFIKKKNFM
jgi:hypothetical protein|tara:strand:+ start:1470 stop:1715 length:246 start_codon:yes stop_codon:yes gene_type:complete